MVVGSGGRMGRAIIKLAPKAGLTVAAKISENSKWPTSGRGIDGVIEFSSPEGFKGAIEWCLRHRKPLVAGATGLKPADKAALKRASKKIPVLYSANMSLGVAVMRAMLEQFGAVADWRFAMEETHHTRKKDKPSGTAKMLATRLIEDTGIRRLPIKAIRRGNVPGTHQIEAFGPDETILLRHTAHDRRVFARGAIKAARWLFDKNRPGLYDLSDLYKV
jgi:4-hydroxy-tetrahydrodipicolinate reductase